METMQSIKTFRFSFRIHSQHSLSTVDGQMRSREKSDLLGGRASAGRWTFEVLHSHVLLVGFDHEPNSCSIS